VGGLLSGRTPWGRSRYEAEECVRVDLYELIRSGLVRPGWCAAGPYSFDGPHGSVLGSVWSDLAEDLVVDLNCTHPDDGRETRTRVACRSISQPFGGERWFFVCPLTGTLVQKLFLPPQEEAFASRGAHNISYRSERLPDAERRYQRLTRFESRLRMEFARRGCLSGFPHRPRGMHAATYERLTARWETLVRPVLADRRRREMALGAMTKRMMHEQTAFERRVGLTDPLGRHCGFQLG